MDWTLKCKIWNYKASRRKYEENASGHWMRQGIFFIRSTSTGNKQKINKLHHSKLKSFFTTKVTINKVKKNNRKLEKIFVNHTSDKGLIPKICKKHKQLNRKKLIFQLMGKDQ
jgi:hypothetical protein